MHTVLQSISSGFNIRTTCWKISDESTLRFSHIIEIDRFSYMSYVVKRSSTTTLEIRSETGEYDLNTSFLTILEQVFTDGNLYLK